VGETGYTVSLDASGQQWQGHRKMVRSPPRNAVTPDVSQRGISSSRRVSGGQKKRQRRNVQTKSESWRCSASNCVATMRELASYE